MERLVLCTARDMVIEDLYDLIFEDKGALLIFPNMQHKIMSHTARLIL